MRVPSARMKLGGRAEVSFGEFGGVRMCLAVCRQCVCEIISRRQDRSLLTHTQKNKKNNNTLTYTHKPHRTIGSISLLMLLKAARPLHCRATGWNKTLRVTFWFWKVDGGAAGEETN